MSGQSWCFLVKYCVKLAIPLLGNRNTKTLKQGRWKMQKQSVGSSAVAFYHEQGFVPAFQQAVRYAGDNGRLATVPDILSARMFSEPGTTAWETYFTTLSAEYMGMSRGGNRIIIVAHGIGPMSTLSGILLAYGYQFKDKTRNKRGGRITSEMFLELESGKYGEVAVIDLNSYLSRYQYPFIQQMRASEALTDPIVKARFGKHAEAYVKRHLKLARKWHAEQAGFDPENRYNLKGHEQFCDRRRAEHLAMARRGSDPFILKVGDAANCSYRYYPLETGMAFGHLLAIGQLMNVHHERHESLISDIDCHEWNNGVRLIGIREAGSVKDINPGADNLRDLMAKHWQKLMRPTGLNSLDGFFVLMSFADQTFTQYAKLGDGMDSYDPEFLVTKMEKIGEPVQFTTTIGGYYGFFKYGISEVQGIAPVGANAYKLAGEPTIVSTGGDPTHHTVPIQFYRIEVDAAHRLVRDEELRANYELMMELAGIGAA